MLPFPLSAVAPFARFPARLSALQNRTPFLLHEALLPLFFLFLTLLLFPYRSSLRNAIALPVIVGLYVRLAILYTSSHWGLAFCVGAGAYFGSLQAFNLLVVKDVGRDKDIRWTTDDTGFKASESKSKRNGVTHGNGFTNGQAHNGHTNGHTNGDAKTLNGHTSQNGNGFTKTPPQPREEEELKGLGYPELASYPLRQRIRFTFSLLCASRGVGFKFQIRRIPSAPPPGTSLLTFLKTHFFNISVTYIILDSFAFALNYDPYFFTPSCWHSPFHPSPLSYSEWQATCFPSLIRSDKMVVAFLYHNFFRKFLSLLAVYAILSQLYSIAAVLFTGLIPLTVPSSWAPLFGPIAEGTTIRGFWTVFWHSIFKKGFSYPGEWVAFKLLKLERGDVWATVIVMFSAFWNSGALHGVGAWTSNNRGTAAAGFFFLQPIGFIVEMWILKLLKNAGINEKGGLGKMITISWMLLWGLWICDVFFYDFLVGGVAGSEPVAWSLWRRLSGDGEAYRWGPPGEWLRWDSESLGGWGLRV